ncbi:hypothetical protein HY750_02460 [Candidatus Kuenenbacteria bacterium]|nr:hypothetical protein [Candidatus Kuenenbacteria bacterium]
MFNAPISDFDFKTILTQIHSEVKTKKIILVGYSQGTLYANEIYNYLVNNGIPKESIAVYNVATPASYVAGNGKYITSYNDKVINQIRDITIKTKSPQPLPGNINIPLSNDEQKDSFAGHLFGKSYLDKAPKSITSGIENKLKNLKNTNENLKTDDGCFDLPDQNWIFKTQEVGFFVADSVSNGTVYVAKAGVNGTVVAAKTTVNSVVGLANSMVDAVVLIENVALKTMDFVANNTINATVATANFTVEIAKNTTKTILTKSNFVRLKNQENKIMANDKFPMTNQIQMTNDKKNEPQEQRNKSILRGSTLGKVEPQEKKVEPQEIKKNIFVIPTEVVSTERRNPLNIEKQNQENINLKNTLDKGSLGDFIIKPIPVLASEPKLTIPVLAQEPILNSSPTSNSLPTYYSNPVTFFSSPASSSSTSSSSPVSVVVLPDPTLPPILISEIYLGLKNSETKFIELYNPNDQEIILNDDNFKLKFIDSENQTTLANIKWTQNKIPSKGYFLFSLTANIDDLQTDATFSDQQNIKEIIISDGQNNIKDKLIIDENLKNNQSMERKLDAKNDEENFSLSQILMPINSLNEKKVFDFQEPETILEKFPDAKTKSTTAFFSFSSNESDVNFQYSLDDQEWENGTSTKEFQNLKLGERILKVRAIDKSGNIDSSPIIFQWQIIEPEPTYLDGEMKEDTILSAENNPYIIENNFTIPENKTLTIGPGVIIWPKNKRINDLFDDIDGANLTVKGTIIINGTKENPVKFTSLNENPQPGDYGQALLIEATSKNSILDNVIFEYGDMFMIYIIPMVQIQGADVKISNAIFRKSRDMALSLIDSNSVIENCIFENNAISLYDDLTNKINFKDDNIPSDIK